MKKQIIITITFLLCLVAAIAQPGTITNITVSQGTGTDLRLVDILFDLSGSVAGYDITLEVSFDDGANYVAIDNANVTGDLVVAPGSNINLVWDGSVNYSAQYANSSRIKITATTYCPSVFVDARDSKSYSTVLIGTQCWMAENLNYDQSAYGGDWCYEDNSANCDTYGRLYDWDALMQGATTSNSNPSGVQGVCPEGWHVPSDAEWTQLTDYLGGVSVAGGKLKEAGTSHWASPNIGATNETDFTALPGGSRDYDGTFYHIGSYGHWWSATESSTSNAWCRAMTYYFSGVFISYSTKEEVGFSVRCLRD